MGAVLALFLLAVIAWDFTRRRVPNALVLAGAAGAVLALAVNHQPFGLTWQQALAGGAITFSAMLLVYALGVMGAGDVKFAGALGLWTGAMPMVSIWIIASLLGGVHALAWLLLRRWPVAPRLLLVLSSPRIPATGKDVAVRKARHVPLAAYLAIATLTWIAWGHGTRMSASSF